MTPSNYKKRCCLITVTALLILFVPMIAFYSLVSFSNVTIGRDLSTLKLLHIVFRHGPRTPADSYPNDPYINHTFHPFGWGHITNSGKLELYDIGSWLRRQYKTFLTDLYHPDIVHAQATGVPRTHMSLQTVLAALYPPRGTAMEWYRKLNWQPIPVYSQNLNDDNLLLVRTPCPRYFEALDEVLQSPAVRQDIQPYQYLFEALSTLTGSNLTEPEDIQSLYLTLKAEEDFGLKLPLWTQNYYPNAMQYLAEQSYLYNVWTREMQRIKAGPFLHKMFTEMQRKADNQLEPILNKLFIYAGHDSTIVNIMHALGIWERQMPRYSAMILFELHQHKETNEYYVEIYFRNNPKEAAQMMQIPGCGTQCPLRQLIHLAKDLLLSEKDIKEHCRPKNDNFIPPQLRGP